MEEIKNPNKPMTKPQRHVIMNKRRKEYGSATLRRYISDKYGIPFEEIELLKLTKEQAQDIIRHFKPHADQMPNN